MRAKGTCMHWCIPYVDLMKLWTYWMVSFSNNTITVTSCTLVLRCIPYCTCWGNYDIIISCGGNSAPSQYETLSWYHLLWIDLPTTSMYLQLSSKGEVSKSSSLPKWNSGCTLVNLHWKKGGQRLTWGVQALCSAWDRLKGTHILVTLYCCIQGCGKRQNKTQSSLNANLLFVKQQY